MKKFLGKHISTIISLLLLVFGCIDLYRVAIGETEFNYEFAGCMLAVSIFLLKTTDKYLMSIFHKYIDKKT